MAPVPIIHQDILTSGADLIVHQEHCQKIGPVSRGLSAQILRRFPGAIPQGRTHLPGMVHLSGPILTLFGQVRPGAPGKVLEDSKEEREAYFQQGLGALFQIVQGSPEPLTIAFPWKIGCGLARGDWTRYRAMIEVFADRVSNRGHTVKLYQIDA